MTTHGKGKAGKLEDNSPKRKRKPRTSKSGVRAKSLGVPITEELSDKLHLLSFVFGVSNCEIARIAITKLADEYEGTLSTLAAARDKAQGTIEGYKCSDPMDV